MRYNRVLILTDVGEDFDGKVLYTNNIISAISEVTNEVTIISYNDSFFEKQKFDKSIVFEKKTKHLFLKYLFSFKPMMVCRSFQKNVQSFLEQISCQYDLIVINHHSMLWATEYINSEVNVLFVTHNVETEVALSRLKVSKNPINIIFGLIDYMKHRIYEKNHINNSMTISAISDHDRNYFHKEYKNKIIKILPFTDLARKKSTLSKKEAVIIGSFFWKIKQQNLYTFLKEAEPHLQSNKDVTLKVIGGKTTKFKESLLANFNIEIHDNVDDFKEYIENSRVGLIIDKAGGGFKLKILDYISYGLPIYSINEGVTSDLNGEGKGFLIFDTYQELIDQLLIDIDDRAKLEKMRDILAEENNQLLSQPNLKLF